MVLEHAAGTVICSEVKAAETIRAEDFRGLRHLANRLGGRFRAGIVFYASEQQLSFGASLDVADADVPAPSVRACAIFLLPPRPGHAGTACCSLAWFRLQRRGPEPARTVTTGPFGITRSSGPNGRGSAPWSRRTLLASRCYSRW